MGLIFLTFRILNQIKEGCWTILHILRNWKYPATNFFLFSTAASKSRKPSPELQAYFKLKGVEPGWVLENLTLGGQNRKMSRAPGRGGLCTGSGTRRDLAVFTRNKAEDWVWALGSYLQLSGQFLHHPNTQGVTGIGETQLLDCINFAFANCTPIPGSLPNISHNLSLYACKCKNDFESLNEN